MWGVFDTDDPYVVHVAPCDKDGNLQKGYILSQGCPDVSHVEMNKYGVLMVIHEEIN